MSSSPSLAGSPAQVRSGALRRWLDRLYLWAGDVGAACIALICVLMVVQSLGRQFGISTGALNDVVAWLCAGAAFLTMAHAFKHGDFVRVTLVLEKLSPAVRRRYELTGLFIGAVGLAYLSWWACAFTYDSWRYQELAQGLWAVPLWIPQLSFALGSVLFFLALVDEFFLVLGGDIPTYVRLVEERHAQGDFSSDL